MKATRSKLQLSQDTKKLRNILNFLSGNKNIRKSLYCTFLNSVDYEFNKTSVMCYVRGYELLKQVNM